MKTHTIAINKIKPNPDNPRTIDKVSFKKLKKSLEDFDVMLNLRPIVVDEDMTILGGNMRYRALTELGYKEVPYKVLSENDIQKAIDKYGEKGVEKTRQDIINEFVVKDNASFGVWDYDMLANEMQYVFLAIYSFRNL